MFDKIIDQSHTNKTSQVYELLLLRGDEKDGEGNSRKHMAPCW